MLTFFLATLESAEDRRLFAAVWEQYHMKMEGTAMRILANQQDAEDAVQNAFLQVIRHFEKIYQIPCEEWLFWLISIVKNEARMILRKRKQTVPLEDWAAAAQKTGEASETPDCAALAALFADLPDSCRLVLEMKILSGYTDREIAAHLGISETAVSTRASRGRALLRKMLEKEGYSL